jgi:hypothetical protein
MVGRIETPGHASRVASRQLSMLPFRTKVEDNAGWKTCDLRGGRHVDALLGFSSGDCDDHHVNRERHRCLSKMFLVCSRWFTKSPASVTRQPTVYSRWKSKWLLGTAQHPTAQHDCLTAMMRKSPRILAFDWSQLRLRLAPACQTLLSVLSIPTISHADHQFQYQCTVATTPIDLEQPRRITSANFRIPTHHNISFQPNNTVTVK